MKNIPKLQIHKAPDAYFDQFPDKVLLKYKRKRARQTWMTAAAAAAVLILGLLLTVFTPQQQPQESLYTGLDETMELYIQAGIWNEHDILSLSENPNELLDLLLTEEWEGMEWELQEEMYDEESYY